MKLVASAAKIQDRDSELIAKAAAHIFGHSIPMNEAIFKQLASAKEDLKPLDAIKVKYSKFALVGIGGSSLGVQVYTQFFSNSRFTFFDNADAVEFENQLLELGSLKDVFWIFISKSGETIETLAALDFVEQLYSSQNLKLSEQSAVVTENKPSSLSTWAREKKVMQFEVPLDVGGRYSALSHVGLVPAYLMNLNIDSLAKGAKEALAQKELIQTFAAATLSSFERQEWITILWGYSSKLKTFGLWWQQLWAESLAKKIDLNGKPALRVSTPVPLVGATDQHSVLQQVIEGHRDKFVVFLRSATAEAGKDRLQKSGLAATQVIQGMRFGDLLRAEAMATQQNLTEEGISNLAFQISAFDEENLGFLFMFMQMVVLVIGKAINVNPLNQPGVERGKVLCKNNLLESRLKI